MRISLSEGSEIKYEEKQMIFIIDTLVGEGANGYVYEAHYVDSQGNEKLVRIKECFPKRDVAARRGDRVEWDVDGQRGKALKRFKKSYDFSSKVQNDVALRNSGVYDLDIFEYNNTKYIVTIPDHGYSYDKEKSDDVVDAVRTALALTNVIGVYHDSGYLHLDIKPSNFIAVDDSTGDGKNIILFDVDSVTSIEDIRNGKVNLVSYSIDWAAPEQQPKQNLDKICPATDLFSVGAVLFYRIMGRLPCYEDEYDKTEWEFDDRLRGKDINPLIREIFTEIFHKTLAEDPDSRYSSAEELSDRLRKVLDLLTSKAPFLISNLSPVSSGCIGRENEISEVYSALGSTGKIFIEGIGGIGKSTLALAYAETHRDEYDAVVWLRYDSSRSIEELLKSIPIGGNIAENKDRYELLQEICDERSLIVLDNLDILATEDNLNLLLQLNCHCIITTRTDFSDVYGQYPRITLSSLSEDSLWTLFERESNHILTNEDQCMLMPLLHWGEECTLFWFLLARLVKTGWYTVEEICGEVTGAFDTFSNLTEVAFNKDESPKRMTITDALDELFRLRNLTDIEKQMMQNIYFLQNIGISVARLREIAKNDNDIILTPYINTLSILIELGYIQRFEDEEGTLNMSDVMSEIFNRNIHPILSESDFVNALIREKFFLNIDNPYSEPSSGWRMDWDDIPLEVDSYKHFYGCLVKLFMRADMSLDANAEYMLDLLYRPSCDVSRLLDLFSPKAGDYLFRELERITSDQNRPQEMRRKAYHILGIFYGDAMFNEISCLRALNYPMDPCEDCFWRELELLDEQSLSPSELDDLCLPIVEYCYIGSVSVEVIEKIIEMNPPILQQEKGAHFETRSAAENPNYQKMYLKESDKKAENLPEPERKELYYNTLVEIFSEPFFEVSPVDAEHFYLLRKFYSESKEQFSDIDKSGSRESDVSEWKLNIIKKKIKKGFQDLNQITEFDTWEDYQENAGNDNEGNVQESDNDKYSFGRVKTYSGPSINKIMNNIDSACENIMYIQDFEDSHGLLEEYEKFEVNLNNLLHVLFCYAEEIREDEKQDLLDLINNVTYVLDCRPELNDEDESKDLYNAIYSFLTIAYAIYGLQEEMIRTFRQLIVLDIEFGVPVEFREEIKRSEERTFIHQCFFVLDEEFSLIKCVGKLAGSDYSLPLFRESVKRLEIFKGQVPDHVYNQKIYEVYKDVIDWADGNFLYRDKYLVQEYRQKMELILNSKFDASDND